MSNKADLISWRQKCACFDAFNDKKLLHNLLEDLRKSETVVNIEGTVVGAESLVNFFKRLFQHFKVVNTGEDFTCDEKFTKFGESAFMVFEVLSCVLENLKREDSFSDSPVEAFNFICISLVLIHEHSSGASAWSNEKACTKTLFLLTGLMQFAKVASPSDLLQVKFSNASVFDECLKLIQPWLKSDNWKRNPATVHCYVGLLTTASFNLFDHLPLVLPPTLLLVDDFEPQNQCTGIQCTQHILEHTSKTEIYLYGRAEVLFCALLRLMYSAEEEVILALLPCILRLAQTIDFNAKDKSNAMKTTKTDELFSILLRNMLLEQKWSVRREYSKHLSNFVNALQLAILKHLPKTFEVVESYLEITDYEAEATRVNILRAIETLINVAWPRILSRYDVIMKCIVRLVLELCQAQDGKKGDDDVLEQCCRVVSLLALLDCNRVANTLEGLSHIEALNIRTQNVLARLQDAATN